MNGSPIRRRRIALAAANSAKENRTGSRQTLFLIAWSDVLPSPYRMQDRAAYDLPRIRPASAAISDSLYTLQTSYVVARPEARRGHIKVAHCSN
jgi:hypothetical protein